MKKILRKAWKGSFTVEAAYLIPFILLLFATMLQLLFYYHDKNVLMAAAQDAAMYGTERLSPNAEEIEEYLKETVVNRLLLFKDVSKEVTVEKEKVTVCCKARKGDWSMEVTGSASVLAPEPFIRNVRKIKKVGESLDDNTKDIHQE